MASRSSYDTVGRAYADSVRSLLAPPASPTAQRAVSAPAAADALTAPATALARHSAELRQATTVELAAANLAERVRASTRLLAQAITDLQISAYLLQVAQVVSGSQAALSKFVIAIRDVDGLIQQQLDPVDKLLRGFRFVGGAAVVAIPQATMLLAAAYIAITGYVVLAGADYVDSVRVKLLNRVPGVRQVVEHSLN